MKKYAIAIVCAAGAVKESLLSILAERNFPVKSLKLLTESVETVGKSDFKAEEVKTEIVSKDSFKNIDFAIFMGSAAISNEFVPVAVKSGAIVIDSSSAFRDIPEIPLVVPEVNPDAVLKHQGIIANPNSTAIIMQLALKPLQNVTKIKRVVAAAYQALSGAEATGLCNEYLKNRDWSSKLTPKTDQFQHKILHDIIPHCDLFLKNGYTVEEMSIFKETQKILGDGQIKVSISCIKVPVATAHSIAMTVETQNKITAKKARELFSKAQGLVLFDVVSETESPEQLLAAGKDNCYIGRIREDISAPNTLSFFISGDHIRKGNALNIIQIMELLTDKDDLKKKKGDCDEH